jgi:hypothetical protein
MSRYIWNKSCIFKINLCNVPHFITGCPRSRPHLDAADCICNVQFNVRSFTFNNNLLMRAWNKLRYNSNGWLEFISSCWIFQDAVQTVDCLAPNGRITDRGLEKKQSQINRGTIRTEENHEKPQDSRCSSLDSNRAQLKYKSTASILFGQFQSHLNKNGHAQCYSDVCCVNVGR